MSIGTASNMEWLVGASNAPSVVRIDNIDSMSTSQTLIHTDDFDITYDAGNVNQCIYLSSSTVDTACVYMQGITVGGMYPSGMPDTMAAERVFGIRSDIPISQQAFSGVSLANPVEIWDFHGGAYPMREFTIFYTKNNVPHMVKITFFCTWIIANNKRVPNSLYASISQI